MALFNRKQTAAAVTATLEVPDTGVPCRARGCTNSNALACAYRDRRGRHCPTAFCAQHSVRVDDVVYCRRHAGTMKALGTRAASRAGLPDVDNRGPSLVDHIAAELDAPVTGLLQSVARADERVLSDDEVTMAFDADRRSRWERSWRLVVSTGVVIKVTLYVDDNGDPMVTVRVGSEMVAEGVPPWIQHRLHKESVADSVDEAERQLFYRFLVENITAAVNQLRVHDDHPSWV